MTKIRITKGEVNEVKRAISLANDGMIPKDSIAAKMESRFAKLANTQNAKALQDNKGK